MRVTVLGSRGNIRPSAPGHAKHSRMLVDHALLLDLGEAAYLDYRPRHIFITHLHSDHAVFMKESAVHLMPSSTNIYVPEPTKKLPDARVISGPVRVDGYRVVPVP